MSVDYVEKYPNFPHLTPAAVGGDEMWAHGLLMGWWDRHGWLPGCAPLSGYQEALVARLLDEPRDPFRPGVR